jgi:hypothetical protein
MIARTYFEHAAGGKPELDVVEFQPPPDAEALTLRTALVRVTEDRDYWRERCHQLQGRVARLLALKATADELRRHPTSSRIVHDEQC